MRRFFNSVATWQTVKRLAFLQSKIAAVPLAAILAPFTLSAADINDNEILSITSLDSLNGIANIAKGGTLTLDGLNGSSDSPLDFTPILSGEGTFIIGDKGANHLKLSSDNSAFKGTIDLKDGSLNIANSLGAATIKASSSAKVDFGYSGTFAGVLNGDFELNLADELTLTKVSRSFTGTAKKQNLRRS